MKLKDIDVLAVKYAGLVAKNAELQAQLAAKDRQLFDARREIDQLKMLVNANDAAMRQLWGE